MNWLLDEVDSKTTVPFKIFRFVDDLFLSFGKPDEMGCFNHVVNQARTSKCTFI